MKVQLKFYSILHDFFHTGEMEITLERPTPAHEIFLNLFEKEKEKGEKFLKSIRVAINCEYVKSNAMVQAGDEIAFIPPVSGG